MKKIKEILKNLWYSFCWHKDCKWITKDLDYGQEFEGTKICNRCNKVVRKFHAAPMVLKKLHDQHPELKKEGVLFPDMDIIADWIDEIQKDPWSVNIV